MQARFPVSEPAERSAKGKLNQGGLDRGMAGVFHRGQHGQAGDVEDATPSAGPWNSRGDGMFFHIRSMTARPGAANSKVLT